MYRKLKGVLLILTAIALSQALPNQADACLFSWLFGGCCGQRTARVAYYAPAPACNPCGQCAPAATARVAYRIPERPWLLPVWRLFQPLQSASSWIRSSRRRVKHVRRRARLAPRHAPPAGRQPVVRRSANLARSRSVSAVTFHKLVIARFTSACR